MRSDTVWLARYIYPGYRDSRLELQDLLKERRTGAIAALASDARYPTTVQRVLRNCTSWTKHHRSFVYALTGSVPVTALATYEAAVLLQQFIGGRNLTEADRGDNGECGGSSRVGSAAA